MVATMPDDGEASHDSGTPPPRRSPILAAVLAAMLAIGLVSGTYMLRHARLPPDPDGGPRCSRLFDVRLHEARGGSDADLMALSDTALEAGCGAKALAAAEAVGGATDEAAAWRLARFSDPVETAPVYRLAAQPSPTEAAALYAGWAGRSPRMAEALKRLCDAAGPSAPLPACRL